MKKAFSRLAALFAFGYQAGATVLMFIALSKLLAPSDYSRFSISFATAQFGAVGCFEWVRLALSRYYPGENEMTERLQKKALYYEYGLSAGMATLVCLGAALLNSDVTHIAMIGFIAVGQGATDILLTAMRFRKMLNTFAITQCLRASLMLVLSAAFACKSASPVVVLSAIAIAHLLTLLCVLITGPQMRYMTLVGDVDRAVFKAHVSYGFPTAAGSMLHLGAVLILRYAISFVASPGQVPGILYAFDLMQRPFNVVAAALHSIYYPPLVSSYDAGDGRRDYWRLLAVEIGSILVILAAIIVVLPFVRSLLVAPMLREGFDVVAIASLLLFGARTIQTNISYLRFHLHKKVAYIGSISLFDIVSYAALLLTASALNITHIMVLFSGAITLTGCQILFSFMASRSLSLSSRQ